jgi:hypothetical protein
MVKSFEDIVDPVPALTPDAVIVTPVLFWMYFPEKPLTGFKTAAVTDVIVGFTDSGTPSVMVVDVVPITDDPFLVTTVIVHDVDVAYGTAFSQLLGICHVAEDTPAAVSFAVCVYELLIAHVTEWLKSDRYGFENETVELLPMLTLLALIELAEYLLVTSTVKVNFVP